MSKMMLKLLVVVVAGFAMAMMASPAQAADLVVNSNEDSGGGTLRAAVSTANGNGVVDNITFNLPEGSRTITLVSQIAFTDTAKTTIDGGTAGVTIRSSGTSLVFSAESANLSLNRLTVNGNPNGIGGGILNNKGTLSVTDSTISGNSSNIGSGGGIHNFQGALDIMDSTISDNSATGEGGGIYSYDGTVSVTGSTISANSANSAGGSGGGIFCGLGTLNVTDSTISGNSTSGFGGGIRSSGMANITGSTINGNSASVRGGGIFSFTDLSGTKTAIENSTISGNTAQAGGGVHNENGLTTIRNSTITNNNTSPANQSAGVSSWGNNAAETKVSTLIGSSIIAANNGTDVDYIVNSTNSFTSEGYNLIGDGNATGSFNKTGDQIIGNNSPGLGALADNGGPTKTHSLLGGSPAIDKGNSDLTTDQRGQARPFNDPDIAPPSGGDNTDIGAFEAQSVLVNKAPLAENDAYSAREDTTLSVTAANGVLSNDSDPEGNALSATLVSGATNGSVTLNSDGSFTYIPNANFNGTDAFAYKASDGSIFATVTTVTISVRAVNDAPKISVVAGSASSSACLAANRGRVTLKLSDADSDVNSLTLSATSSNTTLVPTSNITFGGTGVTRTASVTTVSGLSGTSNLKITVGDGQKSSTAPVTVKSGGAGNNTLSGTTGADLLLGQGGADTLEGLGSSDVLCGAGGNDKLRGGSGADTLDGGSGTDTALDYSAAGGDARINIP